MGTRQANAIFAFCLAMAFERGIRLALRSTASIGQTYFYAVPQKFAHFFFGVRFIQCEVFFMCAVDTSNRTC